MHINKGLVAQFITHLSFIHM